MVFRFALIALLACFVSSANAQVSDPAPVVSRQQLMDVIYAGDFDRVEQIMAETRDLVRRDKATQDDMREKFRDFSTTNPKVIDFVNNWLERHPDSPFANTAQAWVLHRIGWNVRGSKYVRHTYPEALDMHYRMHMAAFDHASRALEADRTLISASDAILSLGQTTGQKNRSFEVLDEVMETIPNWGTLSRALALSNPKYGGSSELADAMCDHYGPMLSAPVKDMVRFCKIVANATYFGNRWDEVREWLKEDPNPVLDHYRVQSIFGLEQPSNDQIRFAVQYFKDTETTDLRLANRFELRYALPPAGEPVVHFVLERAKRVAREVLEHDPYNLWALDVLLRSSHDVTVQPDNSIVHKRTGSPTPEEEVDYHRRRILASPFNPEFWADYASGLQAISNGNGPWPRSLFASDLLMVNAIAYSNHDLNQLFPFIHQKIYQYQRLNFAAEQGWEYGWPELIAETDRYTRIICPLIRAARISDALIEMGQTAKNYDAVRPYDLDVYRELHDEAQAAGRCGREIAADIENLVYLPIEVDLSDPEWLKSGHQVQ